MAKNKGTDNGINTTDYRHDGEKRKNIPLAKIAAEGQIPKVKRAKYHYSPHLSPELRFDPTGNADRVLSIKEKMKDTLTKEELSLLDSALNSHQPWLEWAEKKEQHDRKFFEVDPIALHIHERVSAQAMMKIAARQDVQRDLFADPQQEYQEAVKFYKHDVDWANRMILGDSLQVMTSLARREDLAGKVQMIFMDPPYGIRFGSNFQPEIGKKDVKDKESDLTREPEMVRAYRDTWTLGTHSYLSYLRERMSLAKELLTESGSIFVQISDENLHRVRMLMDEVFGVENFCAIIPFRKRLMPLGATLLEGMCDFLIWFSVSKEKVKFRHLYRQSQPSAESRWTNVEEIDGSRRKLTKEERDDLSCLPDGARVYRLVSQRKPEYFPSNDYEFTFQGKPFRPPRGGCWMASKDIMEVLAKADRLEAEGDNLSYILYHKDFPYSKITNFWVDTAPVQNKRYVVQTAEQVITRCLLMTTDPGDLVLDPTCGSGSTAFVSEQWGRRWITIDTSRVAISLARQRLLTASLPFYRIKNSSQHDSANPAFGFECNKIPHLTRNSIAQNSSLIPIFSKHEEIMANQLANLNNIFKVEVSQSLREKLVVKFAELEKRIGKKNITDSDQRRLLLPKDGWNEWNVPFKSDEDWPSRLSDALSEYRSAWQNKMKEVGDCIAKNAEKSEFVDQPEIVRNVVRVTGPFTVEGVKPEELSLDEDGLFDPTPNEFEGDDVEVPIQVEGQNIISYLTQMVSLIRMDGVTFPNNKHMKFSRIEPLFEQGSGSTLHAEGAWDGTDDGEPNSVAIAFGPQYGPVTATQVEELVRASRRYDELVIAGFSFDAAAAAAIQESQHPKLKIHMAHIRPDAGPGMAGLLKDTPNSQLFTIFGQPEIEVNPTTDGEFKVKLLGVDIYDPLKGEVKSSGADKVAAWFLDSDFDGRCFCITQAFFPNQDAWDKIAKSLGSSADTAAFTAFKGTVSLPFPAGKHKRIAVKVIDPRGNEVMAIAQLGDER
ncbi:modification methylase EcaI [Geobacter sp. OR-1]|uniref:site-specific DNA-methyltransferase n=1 Tax=Geobacter sp. OR-1 TaxID=1266765 RepID=UPI0005424061|nr:site-specific DNA-methyltransferase [Geobacter sp. OR-1]GAM10436.1 modification methylase EcaI [Geobacter sp. OR-1]